MLYGNRLKWLLTAQDCADPNLPRHTSSSAHYATCIDILIIMISAASFGNVEGFVLRCTALCMFCLVVDVPIIFINLLSAYDGNYTLMHR